MTRDQHEGTAAGAAGDLPDIRWDIPVKFHSLGVELPAPEREAHLAEVAAEIWNGGTEYQRTTVASWYRDIADAAAEEGAVYSGFLLARTEDDRVTVATLVVQADPADTSDADAVAAALLEVLSLDPANEVFPVDAPVGPAVVSVAGCVAELDDGAGGTVDLELAQATAYLPVPQADTLLAMTISTPTLTDFPDYLTMLAAMVESVVHLRPGEHLTAPVLPEQSAERFLESFG